MDSPVVTAQGHPDPPPGLCWCCGSIDDPDRMVQLESFGLDKPVGWPALMGRHEAGSVVRRGLGDGSDLEESLLMGVLDQEGQHAG
jgi:hypothetical protein